MKLIPIDNDPFAASGAVSGPRLVPVEHDPFAVAEEQGPPMPPRPANVPLPPPRPGDLGIGAQEMPPVQPLAGDMGPETDYSVSDPQGVMPVAGGKNNLLQELYRRLGVDPRSSMNTGAAYDKQAQKREDAAAGYESAKAGTEEAKGDREAYMQFLRDQAAKGDVVSEQQLQAIESGRMSGADINLGQAEYLQEKARKAKIDEDLRSPATVNPFRNAVESVPKTIGTQLVDTGSAASRIIDKVFEPVDRLMGVDVKANDKKREDYWQERRQWVDGAFNTDPALASDFGQQVVDGVASTAGFMGAGLAGRAVGLGAGLTTAIAGALPQGEQHWRMLDDWYKLHPEQASDWKRWTNFMIGMGSGATEAAPIGHLFARLERAGNGGLTRILGIAAAQGGEEGAQEVLQQLIQNAAQRGYMDPRTPMSEDVANSFLTAAASGALMGGGGAAVARSLQRGADGRPMPNLAPVADEPPPELPPELLSSGGAATATSQPGMTAAATPSPVSPLPAVSAPAAPADNAAPAESLPAEAAPAAGEGAVPSPAAPTPAEAPAAAPEAPTPVSQAKPDEAKLLLGAGYTPEQIAEMGREEIDQAVVDEREAGTKPVDALPPELQPQAPASAAPQTIDGDRVKRLSQIRDAIEGGTATPEMREELEKIAADPDAEKNTQRYAETLLSKVATAAPESAPPASPAKEDLSTIGQGGKAIADNMYDMLWSKVQSGDTTELGKPSAVLQGAKMVRDAGGLKTPEEFRAFGNAFAAATEGKTGQEFQDAARGVVAQFVPAKPGTRAAPVTAEKPEDVAAAAAVANPEPTPAQAEAGNYQHGHLKFDGFDIAIETAKGATRSGTDPGGNAWSTEMPAHYGRIKGTKGADGDQVDVYLGDKPPNGKVFVIDQFDPKTGKFDEVKSVMGVDSAEEARAIYDRGFSDGSGPQRFGGIREVSTDYFRSWLNSPGRSTKPFTPEGRARAAGKEIPAKPAPTPAVPSESPAPSGASDSAAQAVRDSRTLAEGKLPIEDARETQRLENIRKLEEANREPEAPARTLEDVKRDVIIFASGMSRAKDFGAGGYAWGGLTSRGVGVDVGELSNPAIASLAGEIVDRRLQVFVDSGAFSLFRKNLRDQAKADKEAMDLFGDAKPAQWQSMDFDKVLERYGKLTTAIEQANPAEKRDYPRPLLVMPDIVGDQAGSLELVSRYKKWIRTSIDFNTEQPIIPIQRGELSLSEAYDRIVDTLGTDDFIVGIPSNEKAVPLADLKAFLERSRPRKIHFLGAASDKTLTPKLQVVADLGMKFEHLSADANILRSALYGRMDGEGTRAENVVKVLNDRAGVEKVIETARPSDKVARAFFDHFVSGGAFANILQARKMAKEQGEEDVKKVEEAMELAVVSAAKVVTYGKNESDAYDATVDLYSRQPNLNTRTSTSVRDQAYSTPIPLAYVAQRLAGITKTDFVYEPTAGNGALLFTADPDRVVANELNKGRADNLEAQGYAVTEYDASAETTREKIVKLNGDERFDVVIGNPPFGKVQEDGRPKVFNLNDQRSGYTTTDIDHAIVVRTLGMMRPDGRAVFIVGAPGKQDNAADAYHGQNKRAFFKFLWDHYNVTDHFTVGGNLYARQGTQWPVDVIVIDGRGKTARPLPAVTPPPVLTTWDQVKEKLDGRNRPGLGRPDQALGELGARGAEGAVPGDTGPAGQGGPAVDGAQQEQPEGVLEPAVQPEQKPADGEAGGAVAGESGTRKPDRPRREPDGKRRPPAVESGDAAFDAAFDQLFGEQKPAAAPQAAPAGPRADTRTPGQIAKSAASEAAMGLDDALSGLYQLFGGGKTIGSGPAFDEETYAKARPFFVAAAQHLKNAAKDLVALARAIMQSMIDKFGDAARDTVQRMRPYIVRFVDDVKKGAIDLSKREEPKKAPEEKPGDAPAAPKKSAPQEKETDKQVAYTPTSKHGGLGTLVPINMQTAIQNALEKIAAEHESVDKFVASELGYVPGSNAFHSAFAAEQVDAIALALSNFKKGAGFIIGDQTGIGKGRVNAAVIRWAIKNGKTPIFVTEKPNLYGDMYRDLSDIGIQEFIGREPKLLMTNTGQKIPLNQAALDSVAARKLAKETGQTLPPEDGFFLKSKGSKAHEAVLKGFAEAGNVGDHDVVFTTYSQMQSVKGKETERMRFLRSIAPNAVVIFDESHNAGGQEGKPRVKKGAPTPIPRSKTARDLVAAAQAVFYSSATFAKRPSVMDLYAKTDMRLAVGNIEELAGLIKDGGVPMQQVVSTMLAEAGQYIRRERSFDGVVYDTPVLDVDREKYNEFAGALQAILEFSRAMSPVVEQIADDVKAEAAAVTEDNSTGEAGADSLLFTSVMHNLIGQYLLAAKADIAADRAIEALKKGEKPVLTVANTLESFLAEFAEDNDLKPGSPITIDFTQLLQRYLERTRQITIKDAFGKKRKHYLSDEELGPAALQAYDDAKQYIADLDFGTLPISPIDWMHHRLRKAGYNTAEITGRGLTIEYKTPGKGVLKARPASDVQATGRLQNIGKFNNETVSKDGQRVGVAAIILNQAGSTGLSLHASSSFRNTNPRVMIIVQAEANIDTHMQMLGRIHRTGQIVLPRYEQLIGNVPAEKRPAAVLQKKMASLNASTTASREGALTGKDVPDFINQYGDMVAKQWLKENDDIAPMLGDLDLGEEKKKDGEATEDGAMRKLTGRIPLLDLALQEQVYEDLEQRYADLIEQLEATGLNSLEAKALDLDAKQIESVTLREGSGESPFDGPATLGIYDIKRQGKPVTGAEVLAALARAVSAYDKENADYYGSLVLSAGTDKRKVAQAVDAINNRIRQRDKVRLEEALKAGRAYIAEKVAAEEDDEKKEAVRERLTENLNRFESLMRELDPGHKVRLTLPDGEVYTGVVMKVAHGGKAPNPLALGTWRATIAVPLNNPMVPISLASMQGNDEDGKIRLEDATYEPLETTLDLFDQLAAGGAREKRIIATGNILAAFSSLKGKGQIISFTDDQGRKQPGIMMPAKLKKLTDITDSIGRPLTTAPEVLDYLREKGGGPIFDTARNLEIALKYGGSYINVRTQGAKGKGGRYYLDPGVLQALGQDFYKSGPWMQAEVDVSRAPAVVEALLKAGARFEAPPVKKQKGPTGTAEKQLDTAPPAPVLTPAGARVEQLVRDIVAQIVGLQNADVRTAPALYSRDATANARSGGPGTAGQEIAGSAAFFENAKPLISVSLNERANQVETTYHEAFHVLQGLSAITADEHQVLAREHERMRQAIARTGRNTAGMSGSELEAYAFQVYAAARRAGLPGPVGLHIAVRRIFEKLLQIITRIGNRLRGLGYRSAEDVFAAAYTGEIGARIGTREQSARAAGAPAGIAYSTFSDRAQRDLEAYNRNAGWTPLPARATQKSFQESSPTVVDESLRKLADSFITLRRYQQDITSQIGNIAEGQDAYNAAQLFPGRTAARLEDFKADHVDPLIEAMKEADVGQDELGMGLLARHAVERNDFIQNRDPANDMGSGLKSDAAREIIADMTASGLWARLQPLFARVDAMIEADRRVRKAAGLISDQTYQEWRQRFQNYVPLQGTNAEDETEADGFSTGWGFDVRGRESKIAFGRHTIPNNPLHNVIAQAQAGIIRAEKNRVDRALLKLVQANPNPDLWRVNERRYVPALNAAGKKIMVLDHSLRSEPNVLGVKVGGKVTYITLKDMQLAEAFRQLPNDAARNVFMRGLGQVTRAYAQLQTGKNLEFFVRNVPRDLQEAVFTLFAENPKLVGSFVKAFPEAMNIERKVVRKEITGKDTLSAQDRQWYDEWRRNGGQISFSAYRDMETIAEDSRKALGGTDSVTLSTAPGIAGRLTAKVAHALFLKWVGTINEGFENSTRLAVFMAARRNGYSPARAARLAREATVNFSRRGQWTTTISAAKMFFNPNVQGNVKTLQMLIGERNATDEQKARARRARILYGSMVPLGSMLAMWNLAAGGDDDDEQRPGKTRSLYMTIPDYVRDQNIVFIYGTREVNGKKLPVYLKIPKAFALGIPITLGEQMVLLARGQQTVGGAAAATMRSLMGVMNPLGSQNPLEAGFWINQVLPTVATPAVDISLNRDWTNRPIVPPQEPWNRGVPNAQQYFSTTSPAAIDAAQWMRDKTGGAVDVYPGHLQYAVQWVTGGAGRFWKGTWDAAANAMAGTPTPMERLPIVRQFVGKVDTAAEQDLYYKNRQAAVERFNRVNGAKNALQNGSMDSIVQRDFEQGAADLGLGFKKGRFERKHSLLGVYDAADKEVKSIRDQINEVRRDRGLPLAERERKVGELRNQMDTVMRRARRDAAVFPAYQN